jgi:hypothetical protein
MLGDSVLGDIEVSDADFPWLLGRFVAGPAFSSVAHLFARELDLVNSDDLDAWEAAYRAIESQDLRLLRPDGTAVAEVLLHVDGDTAWFRWSDEPFEVT